MLCFLDRLSPFYIVPPASLKIILLGPKMAANTQHQLSSSNRISISSLLNQTPDDIDQLPASPISRNMASPRPSDDSVSPSPGKPPGPASGDNVNHQHTTNFLPVLHHHYMPYSYVPSMLRPRHSAPLSRDYRVSKLPARPYTSEELQLLQHQRGTLGRSWSAVQKTFNEHFLPREVGGLRNRYYRLQQRKW